MAQPPNLVFVFADQLRLQSCGYSLQYAEDPTPYTPNIDRLAEESADFRNAVAGTPMCAPYRSSLFTGKYPSSTGMVINELRAMPDSDAIAHVLNRHGYETCYLGKWHLFGRDHTDSEQFVPPGPDRLGFDDTWKAYNFNHRYYDGFYYGDSAEQCSIEGYQPHQMTDFAIEALERTVETESPLALFLSYGPPHDPWTWDNCPEPFNHLFRDQSFPDPPNYADGHAKYWDRSMDSEWWEREWKPDRFRKRQAYAAQIASIDWELGRLLRTLEETGLEENTVFTFTSDHGEMFGSHGRIAKNIFYEEAVRVPFLVRYPDAVPPGRRSTPLNTPDIAPTLLGLLDLPVPDSMEGTNLSHRVRGDPGQEPMAAFLQGMGHTYQWENGNEWRAARDKRYTYARWIDGSEELYDNMADPYQQENLVEQLGSREVLSRLRTFLDQQLNELNDPFKETTWYRNRWVEDRVIQRSATRKRTSDGTDSVPRQ